MRRSLHRRVAVTGLGVVLGRAPTGGDPADGPTGADPAGVGGDIVGPAALWTALLAPQRPGALRPVTGSPAAGWLARVELRRLDPFAGLAVVAAGQALTDAGMLTDDRGLVDGMDRTRVAAVVGTGMGGAWAHEDAVEARREKGGDRVSPYTMPMAMPNAAAAAVALRFGLTGPCEAVTTACAAGAGSIAAAARMVADGRADLAVAGGADACATPSYVSALTRMGALSRSGWSRPFAAGRDGFCLADGAAAVVLEPLDTALARGATVHLEVLGAASTCDAHHVTAPPPGGDGAARCIAAALADAEIAAGDLGHVNAHGTGTTLNDAAESAALRRVLGADGPAVTSVKGVTGHSFGAAGAVEAVAVALSVRHRTVPPTDGLAGAGAGAGAGGGADADGIAADCGGIDVVTAARAGEPGPVLSNSFGFGGHNTSLVLAPAGWRA